MTVAAYTLDAASAAATAGEAACKVNATTVTRGVAAALALYPVVGIFTAAANPNTSASVLLDGHPPPSMTGLAALAGKCRVNPTTARPERVASLGPSDYPLGDIDASGYLELQLEPISVGTRAEVQALTTPRHNAYVQCFDAGGPFRFDAFSAATVDGLAVLAAADGTRGRWVFSGISAAYGPGALLADYNTVANATGRTGAYTSSTQTYTSTIDAALTTLSALVKYDNGVAAAAIAAGKKLPILLFLHGYSQDAGYISDALKARAADAGFVAVAPHQRGRGGNPGSADDCRDLQDIIDAIAAAAAAYPTVVDTSRVHVLGYSGGGAAAVALATKFPGRCISIVSCFGWGDVGLDPRLDHSYWGSRDARSVVVTRVGSRNDLERYRARSSLGNIGAAITQASGVLWLLWDAQDPIGRCLRDVRDALIIAGAPTSRWLANETDTGSSPRWLHGYPETNADLISAEQLVYRRRDELAPMIVHAGTYEVAGYVVHAAGFELWTADSGANAKFAAAGGQKHSVSVQFDVGSQQYRVTPKSGTCVVTIVQGRRSLTKTVSTATTFDLANSLEAIIPDAKHVIDMARGVVLAGSNITSVADQIIGATLVPPGAAIVYSTGDAEYPAAKFIGNNDNLRGDTLSLLTAHDDFAVAVRFRATLGQSAQTVVAYADGTVNQFVTIYVDDTTWNAQYEGTSSSGAVSFNGYSHSVGTPGVTSWWNIAFMWRSGSNLFLQVNAEVPTAGGAISNPSNNCAATRLSLGSLDRSAGNSEIRPLVGAVSHVVSVVGRVFTAQERADLYDHMFQAGEFRNIV